jgi:hypothetical protein
MKAEEIACPKLLDVKPTALIPVFCKGPASGRLVRHAEVPGLADDRLETLAADEGPCSEGEVDGRGRQRAWLEMKRRGCEAPDRKP